MLSSYEWIDFKSQSLNLDHTNIFKIYIPEVISFVTEKKNRFLLSTKENEKLDRFKFLADKERFLTARVVLKRMLELITNQCLKGTDFAVNEYGKPFFNNIEFNISHSGGYVVIAISNTPVGIDVEILKDNFNFDIILQNTFNPEEISYINKSQNRKESFLTLWTRKEALLKTTGEGLIDDLPSISVLSEEVNRMTSTYTLKSFKINNVDIASVAFLNTAKRIKTYSIRSSFFNFNN